MLPAAGPTSSVLPTTPINETEEWVEPQHHCLVVKRSERSSGYNTAACTIANCGPTTRRMVVFGLIIGFLIELSFLNLTKFLVASMQPQNNPSLSTIATTFSYPFMTIVLLLTWCLPVQVAIMACMDCLFHRIIAAMQENETKSVVVVDDTGGDHHHEDCCQVESYRRFMKGALIGTCFACAVIADGPTANAVYYFLPVAAAMTLFCGMSPLQLCNDN